MARHRPRIIAAALAASVTLVLGSALPAHAVGDDRPAFAATAAQARSDARALLEGGTVTSVSLALVAGDRTVWSTTVGRVDEAGTRPTPSTLYGVGSVSKMLTAIAVMQLVDAGVVSLDAPVTDYVTDFRMASPEYREITVRMLLNHTAGLPGSDYANAITTMPYREYAQQVLDTLAVSRLKSTPGAMSVYCNDCFTLAGVLVERMSGLDYPDYVEQRILEPLGMTRTRYATEPLAEGDVAPFIIDEGTAPPEGTNFYAAGGLLSTPTEMGRLASMLMNGGVLDGVRILSREAVREMGRPQVAGTLTPSKPPYFQFGLGWDSVSEPGLAAVGVDGWVKGGDTNQYHAAFTLAPEEELAAVVLAVGLTNSSVLETLAQRMLLSALVEEDVISAVPVPTSDVPDRTPPTSRELVDIAGIYLSSGTVFKVTPQPDRSVRMDVLRDGEWIPGERLLTHRADGRFWSASEPYDALGLARGWGRTYLVLDRPGGAGHYREQVVLGQKATSVDALAPEWRARLGGTWLTVDERADSALWQIRPTLTLAEIPGLTGYLWVGDPFAPAPVDARSDGRTATMFLTIPTIQGRDINDLVVVDRGGEEWLRFGGTLARPLDSVPILGIDDVVIGPEGYAEWRSIESESALVLAGAGAWRLFGADGSTLSAGNGDIDVAAPAGSLLVLFGDPGSVWEVRHGS